MASARRALLIGLALAFGLASGPASARLCVEDDAGENVCLDQPARRIVALSPAAVELLYEAGAGARLVGAVSYSDYPEAALELPRVGDHSRLDMERLLALKPDLVIGWQGGNPKEQLARLEALGLPVFLLAPQDFAAIADALEALGMLAGSPAKAEIAAADLRDGVKALRRRYAQASPVRAFYQIWDQPMMTVNGEHWISHSLALCGGVNVFADQAPLVPRVGREAVLAAAPEAIIGGGTAASGDDWKAAWRRFPQLQAVARGNLFVVDPDLIQRPTPRLLQGTRALCRHLETARERR